jgi:hypothetical protein
VNRNRAGNCRPHLFDVAEHPHQRLAGRHMFVTDPPRILGLASPPAFFWHRWRYHNFREFMRVRFDGTRPSGYIHNPPEPPPNPNDRYYVDGSQCSDKEPWHSRISISWLGMGLKWQRFDGGANALGPGNPAIGNDP